MNKETNLEIVYRKRLKPKIFFNKNELLTIIYSLIDAFHFWKIWEFVTAV